MIMIKFTLNVRFYEAFYFIYRVNIYCFPFKDPIAEAHPDFYHLSRYFCLYYLNPQENFSLRASSSLSKMSLTKIK